MKLPLWILSAALFVTAVATTCPAFGQSPDEDLTPAVHHPPGMPVVSPRYAAVAPRYRDDFFAASSLTTVTNWSGSFTAGGVKYNFRMVGTDPTRGSATTTVPAYLIPVKITLSTGAVYDPGKRVTGTTGNVTQNVQLSPIFQSSSYQAGTVDLGFTQYVDAFQRGSLWASVSKATNYHVLLGTPTVLPTLNLTVPAVSGKTTLAFGITAAYLDINYFDAQLQQYMKAHPQITPNSLPIFLTLNTYLHDTGGCCIGGYHSATGSSSAPQTYVYSTYADKTGAFSEDVAALSHEVGEWMDDPFVNNNSPCGILEVGDPLVNQDYPVALNGITYHPEDLAFLSWFALDKPSKGAGGKYSLRGGLTATCK